MDGFGDVLVALGGWAQVGAGALLVVVVVAILRGHLHPPGLIAREDVDRQVRELVRVYEGRVQDAVSRAERAEGDAQTWGEAWRASESGRRIAAEHVETLLSGVAGITRMLESEIARDAAWRDTKQNSSR